ncbi:MAG: esterase-like activity of phytase family protein [Aureispira sp.]|nr:esterase-like activity of phytase family protein [Aureispira sp.]
MFRVLITILFSVAFLSLTAQNIKSLSYVGHCQVVTEEDQINPLDGISGIEATAFPNTYYLITDVDASPILYYDFNIELNNMGIDLKVNTGVSKWSKEDVTRGECIRLRPTTNELYISTEEEYKGADRTRILKVWPEREEILIETNLYTNSGFEGFDFSEDGKYLYVAMECCPDKKETWDTYIKKYDVETKKEVASYNYQLDKHAETVKNGISEILLINNSTLLILERVYLYDKRKNIIRIYKGTIGKKKIKKTKVFDSDEITPKGKVILDNIEGMTLSTDKKHIILVSDNNAMPQRQVAQVVFLKIEE